MTRNPAPSRKLPATTTVTTPIGPFTILARDETVLAAGFTDDVQALLPLVHPELRAPGDADLDRMTKAVHAYFEGDLTAIDAIAVEQRGAPFLSQGWAALRTVPA